MSNHGRFVWYELMTSDPDAAKAFYPKVVGTQVQKWEGEFDYAMWVGENGPMGGVMQLPEEAKAMGAPPHWMGYVEVDDVDAAAEKAKSLGATIFVPPMDIPGVGRFCTLADPTGAAISIMTSATKDWNPPAVGVGGVAWHELYTMDLDAAWGFYAEMFGWQKADAMDMGPEMGVYQLFAAADDSAIGGMMKCPPGMPMSAWGYYLHVADLDAALATAKELGAQIVNGPIEVPGGDRVATGADPQGAMFSLHETKR